MVVSRTAAFVQERRLVAVWRTLGRMIHIVRREVAAAAPFGEAAGRSNIFSSGYAMLGVVDYGLPTRLCDDPPRRQSTMPCLNIGHGDHVTTDAVAAFLESENSVPTIERSNASALGCGSFNRCHFANRRRADGTPRHMEEAKKEQSRGFHLCAPHHVRRTSAIGRHDFVRNGKLWARTDDPSRSYPHA